MAVVCAFVWLLVGNVNALLFVVGNAGEDDDPEEGHHIHEEYSELCRNVIEVDEACNGPHFPV